MRFNDFLFAAHGAFFCVIIYSQFFPSIWGFKVGLSQKASKAALGIFWGSILGILVVTLLARTWGKDGGYDPEGWAWIDVVRMARTYTALVTDLRKVYALGYCKLITVVVKYIPQAWVNYKRKSTEGWSIYPMLLDFTGGWLSIGQLIIDSSLQSDWTGITGSYSEMQ